GECKVRLAACSTLIDGDASSKVINAAPDRIDGNTLYCCPGRSICRGTHHDVVSGTVRFKSTIGPDYVDFPRLVDFSGRKRATTIRRLLDVICNGRDDNRIVPTCTTVP